MKKAKLLACLLGLWLVPGQAFAEEKKGKTPEIKLLEKNWGEANNADVLAVLRSTARQLFPYSNRNDWDAIHVGRSSKCRHGGGGRQSPAYAVTPKAAGFRNNYTGVRP